MTLKINQNKCLTQRSPRKITFVNYKRFSHFKDYNKIFLIKKMKTNSILLSPIYIIFEITNFKKIQSGVMKLNYLVRFIRDFEKLITK